MAVKKFICGALFIFLSLILQGQPNIPFQKRIKLDHFSVSSGLSQSSVLNMLQDSHGFIWLGTRDGLNLFNGYEFTIFRNIAGDTTSLSGNLINSLAEDHEGNIWVATDRGLSCYQRSSGNFKTILEAEFRTLTVDVSGTLWAGAQDGLHYFDNSHKTLEKFKEPIPQVSTHAITSLFVDADNNVWVGTARHGLFQIAADRKNVIAHEQLFTNTKNTFGSNRIEAIIRDAQQNLWIGTYGNGLFRFSLATGTVSHYHQQSQDISIGNNNVRALTFDDLGNLWVGTFGGISILNTSLGKVKRLVAEDGAPDGLSHNSIRSLLLDSKGSVWIGTYFGGVNVYDQDNQRFEHFYHMATNTQSLSFNVVGAFAEDKSGNLLIGTEGGGITAITPQQNYQFYNHQPPASGLISGNTVKSLLVDRTNNVWAGIFRGGLNKIDLATHRVVKFPNQQPEFEKLSRSIVNTIVEDKQSKFLWLGTDDAGGLHKFDLKRQRFVLFNHHDDLAVAIGSSPVKSIWIDENNWLWLATRGSGMIVFSEAQGVVHHFQKSTSGLPSNELTHIFCATDGTLWLSTQGEGVVRYDRSARQFDRLNVDHGLQNNQVYGTLQDGLGNLWFMTINGVSRYSLNTQVFTNYSHASGFPVQEINEGAFYKLSDGNFLVGGSNGYAMFNPAQVASNKFVPPIVITDVLVYNKRVNPGDETGVLGEEILVTDAIQLGWHQSVFTIEFAALSYLRSEENKYQYKLEGFDDRWMEAGHRRSVTYTNLRDGTYTFYVRGSNNDGVWSNQPATLKIYVLPPPWKTWWAFIGYGLVIVAGFMIFRYNALKSAQLKHDLKMEQLNKERIEEMHKLKLQYFTDVSHEFRTPLTLIVNPLEEMIRSNEGTPWYQKQLRIMYYNCRRLLLLIDQVLEMRQVETGHASLQLMPTSVVAIVTNIIESFRGLADHQHINLQLTTTEDDNVLVKADVDKLEKIFFNLLSNAFKFTPEGGFIRVQVKKRMDGDTVYFVFKVSDTGRGIDKQELPKIFDRFYRQGENRGSGIGLSLTRSFIELMNGSIRVQSKVNEGTSFTFRIPFEVHERTETTMSGVVRPLPSEYRAFIAHEQETLQEQEDGAPVILVVEDNKDLRNYLKENLSKKFRVITARNGEKGLAKAFKFGPQLIVSDVMMDIMDGIELCKRIKSDVSLSHIPVILLTAKGTDIDRLTGLEEGADDYLVKPFIMHELELRINNMLDNRKRVHDLYRKTNSYSPKLITVTGYDEKLMERIMRVIEEHIHQPSLSVEFVGREVGLSRVHLFRKLKALTGQAPADFIKNIRLQRAEQLLQQNKLKVWEVADRVGFQDVNYFSKCFRKVYGKSPSDYGQEVVDNSGSSF